MQAGGQEFDSPHLHHTKTDTLEVSVFVCRRYRRRKPPKAVRRSGLDAKQTEPWSLEQGNTPVTPRAFGEENRRFNNKKATFVAFLLSEIFRFGISFVAVPVHIIVRSVSAMDIFNSTAYRDFAYNIGRILFRCGP